MARQMSKSEETLERLKMLLNKQNETQKKYQNYNQGTCMIISGSTDVCKTPEYVNAYDSQGYSCARVLSSAYNPNNSRHDDWDKARIDILQKECQNLTDQKNKAWLANMKSQEEINRLKQELFELKNKKAKRKDFDVAVYNTFTKIGIGFKTIYQDIINWFNT